MGFFKKDKDVIINGSFNPIKDIASIKAGIMVDLRLYTDHLTLKNYTVKQPITLNYSQITDVFYGNITEVQEKNKSTIGRAVAGGLLFGGAGAVVGAMTASGKKEKKVTKIMLIISYTSSQGEECFLELQDASFKGKKISAKLKELCNIKDKEPEVITEL